MELSKEQVDFLNECEEEFQNRYTDADEDFLKVKLSTLIKPPILDPWPARETQEDKYRNHRDSNRRSQRRYEKKGSNDRYRGNRERCSRDRRRTKRKSRDCDDREKNYDRNRKEKDDDRRNGDRRRHKDHRRSEDKDRKRRGGSYRDEDRDGRYRRDNNLRDRRRNRDNYRERESYEEKEKGKSRQECTEQDGKGKVCENENPILEQNIWNMYVSKHDLYENYRPYF